MNERCEHCHRTDEAVRQCVVGGIMPGSIPLHAHMLHVDCAPLYKRGQCDSCCSVIVSSSGGRGTGRRNAPVGGGS